MVNLSDFKYKETTRHGKPVKNRMYRHSCDNCGADRGYQAKSFITKSCNKCSHLGKCASEDTKIKMAISAINRYNDPNWKPKTLKPKFLGQRRTIYISKLTEEQKKLKHAIRTLLNSKIKSRGISKNNRTFDLLGYSVDDLKKHLEAKFQPGMTWDNYGLHGWHIDHIKPDSWFIYSSTKDKSFKDSWSLNNLQPMWASENCSKGDRYAGDFR